MTYIIYKCVLNVFVIVSAKKIMKKTAEKEVTLKVSKDIL